MHKDPTKTVPSQEEEQQQGPIGNREAPRLLGRSAFDGARDSAEGATGKHLGNRQWCLMCSSKCSGRAKIAHCSEGQK